MKQYADHRAATYGPMQQKSFAGALGAFFAAECPQLGGERTRRVLVEAVVDMVDRFYPKTTHLRPGQIQWTTVSKHEQPSYGRTIQDSQLTSVVLDLVRPEDVADRAQGKSLSALKREAAVRLFEQADRQDGCLTQAEVGLLLKLSPLTVAKYVRDWEAEHQKVLPRRGTVHDLGPTQTHKRQIIEKLFLEGQSVQDVCRQTHHSPEAVHRYIQAFKQVLLCQRRGLSPQEIAFAVKMSPKLVSEYMELIDRFAADNAAVKALLQPEPEGDT
jgi:predicted transcriptional regulator